MGNCNVGLSEIKTINWFVSLDMGRKRNGDLLHCVGQECVNSTLQKNMDLK